MAYPDVNCGDLDVPPGCCEKVWDQGLALLAAVATPVLNCVLDSPCGGDLRAFISLGRPETWQTDFVAVWLNGISFTNRSITQSGGLVIAPDLRVEWNVLLWESNYPGLVPISDDELAVPSDDTFHAANHHAYAHGEAMFRGIMEYVTTSTCSNYALRGFGPATPENYSAGWIAGIALDITL